MSQSPTEATTEATAGATAGASAGASEQSAAYSAGWTAVSRLLRRGFSWSGHERDCAFLNLGGWDDAGGSFAEVAAVAGLNFEQDGRAAAVVDWDFDGDQDLVVTARTGPRLRFLENGQRSGNAFLATRLQGRSVNADGIGARVEVQLADGRLLSASRRAGEGFQAQSSAWLHFGLGPDPGATLEVRVRWPDGEWESFGTARKNQFLVLVQGTGDAREWPAPSVPALASAGALALPPASGVARIVPRAPIPMPTLEAFNLSGVRSAFLGITPGGPRGSGRPLLLNFFSHTCAPCARELADLAAQAEALNARGIDRVALSVDPQQEREQVLAFVERTGFDGTVGFATAGTMETIDALQSLLLDHDRRMPVPTSLLIDERGYLQVLYLGPVDALQVISDAQLSTLEPGPRRMAALPFPGRFLGPPHPADLVWLEAGFNSRGLPQVAAEFALGRLEVRRVGEAQLQIDFGKARIQQKNLEAAERHFQRAADLDPYATDAWKGLGYCLHQAGRLEEARDAYREGARLDPEDELNQTNLGMVLVDLEELEGARAVLEWLRARGSSYAQNLERALGD